MNPNCLLRLRMEHILISIKNPEFIYIINKPEIVCFVNEFNNRFRLLRENMEIKNEVIMEDYLYYLIAGCYNETRTLFEINGYKWNYIFEICYIVISWDPEDVKCGWNLE